MFKISPIVLTTLMLGFIGSATAAGCYPAWRSGFSYNKQDLVSHTTTASKTTTTTAGVTTTATTTKTINYQCSNNEYYQFCGSYAPDGGPGTYAAVAWSSKGECTGTATLPSPTNKPTPVAWTGGGCPGAFKAGEEYADKEKVEADGIVYQCKGNGAAANWCGTSSYEPGTGTNWGAAWTLLGSCTGTISPTTSPVYPFSAYALTGCPEDYSDGKDYEAGDKVAKNGVAFKCKDFPASLWCKSSAYEPLGPNYAMAWTVLGTCTGTISPTASPMFPANAPGCPDTYSSGTEYEAGDKVEYRSGVYQCKSWPSSGYCNQFGPDDENEVNWKLGWTKVSSCTGTISPTAAPVRNPANQWAKDGCPGKFAKGTEYEEGDQVEVDSVVYQCKKFPYSGYCKLDGYTPGTDAGKLGWSKLGWCDGTISPTAAPMFPAGTAGCPDAYVGTAVYEGGDKVMIANAAGGVVYACRPWPQSGYCNAGPNYAPGSKNSSIGWTKVGGCIGTFSPTTSPRHIGNDAGRCPNEYAAGTSTYKAGTKVQYNDFIYQCKSDVHASKYCAQAAYGPDKSYWSMAWNKLGWCDGTISPTLSPTKAPTKAPTAAPTKAPTKAPTAAPTKAPTNPPTAPLG